jgi:hypothetical protein
MHDISDEQYEKLREILESEYGKLCTFEEAKIIGDGLIDIYTIMSDSESNSDMVGNDCEQST